MTLRIFRVTVRGRFDDLDAAARSRLFADATGHDVTKAAFTEAGTLTYDPSLRSFTFRFRLRDDASAASDAEANVTAMAVSMVDAWLSDLAVTGSQLRVDAHDMADVWDHRV